MEKAEYAIEQRINGSEFVECTVVHLKHKLFDMFDATFINLNGEEETNLITIGDLIPKNDKATSTLRSIMGRL